MKHKILRIYSVILVLLVIIAWAVFRQIGMLHQAMTHHPMQEQWADSVYKLEYWLIFLFSALFITLIGLIVFSFINTGKEKLYSETLQTTDSADNKITDEPTQSESENQEGLNDEIKNREAKITGCLRNQIRQLKSQDDKEISKIILSCLSKSFEITQAELFLKEKTHDKEKFILSATYAIFIPEDKTIEFEPGEGLIGQVGKSGNRMLLKDLPEGYLNVKSGLGAANAANLLIIPWKSKNNEVFAVLEIASFKSLDDEDISILEKMGKKIKDFYE